MAGRWDPARRLWMGKAPTPPPTGPPTLGHRWDPVRRRWIGRPAVKAVPRGVGAVASGPTALGRRWDPVHRCWVGPPRAAVTVPPAVSRPATVAPPLGAPARPRKRRAATGAVVHRWDLLNALLALSHERRFLEIGVRNGECGSRVRASLKWGVDPAPRSDARRHYSRFFETTSDDFFRRARDARFDVVFIDGLHHARQVHRDVENALGVLDAGGTIVLHDCNPKSELVQRVPRQSSHWNGDCWKAVVKLRAERPDLDVSVVDTDEGLGIVRRAAERREPLALGVDAMTLSYAQLDRHRASFLNLVPPARWYDAAGVRLTVVTATFGRHDRVHEPAAPARGVRYVCFTDGRMRSDRWEVVPTRFDGLSPRLQNRRVKMLLEGLDAEEGDSVLYLDAQLRPRGDPRALLVQHGRADVALCRHPWNDCAYDEAADCIRLGRGSRKGIEQQVARFRSAGFPRKHGLWAGGVVLRRFNERTRRFGELWWRLVRATERDQVSLPFALWKLGISPSVIGGSPYRNALWSRTRGTKRPRG